MDLAIEPLVKTLEDTNRIKEYSNKVCEETWNIYSSYGSQTNGLFLKDNTSPSIEPVLDEITQGSSIESIHHNVDSLIEYAKFVRSSHSSKKLSTKEKILLEDKKIKILKSTSSNNILLDPVEGENKLKNQSNSKKKVAAKRQNNRANCEEYVVTENFPTSQPQIFSHSCSSTLNDNVKSLKITKDHLHILRQYHCFESLKNMVLVKGNPENIMMDGFKDKSDKHVKEKLKTHLVKNIKNEEKYFKYLDLASKTNSDCIQKHCSNSTSLGNMTSLQYSTLTELHRFELKYQYLLELQLQSEILNNILNGLR